MAVQESTVINASVEQVVEALSSEDFARFVCSEAGVAFGSFMFVVNCVFMSQGDSVRAPGASRARTVTTEVKVNGIPVSASATQHLIPEGDKTRLDVNGEVSCSIPLVGKKIAAAAEPQVGRVLKVLGTSAEKWIAQR